jgi:hypothetical protein
VPSQCCRIAARETGFSFFRELASLRDIASSRVRLVIVFSRCKSKSTDGFYILDRKSNRRSFDFGRRSQLRTAAFAQEDGSRFNLARVGVP